ncbi:hypothetical protein D7D52_02205 [Nocardia yunnanensis]|uniref:Uncharacterized protein n=1 Tax=Nocardia yunnanensis TaxID=2382165 RepID=A0A386Z6K1_9NOCA|nr:hypothetical protein [Nocardia yunnanensis]AYF72873.1 hypothetical protein D7D52_02205 [Nocardia yunnanensis]
MHARNLVAALAALTATATFTVTAAADARAADPLSVDTAVAANGNAVIGISYQCAPGLPAQLSVTVRETPYVSPGVSGPGINGSALAPTLCIGQPQQTTVSVNPVQLFGDPAEFQSGSTTDVTVTVLALTPNSPLITARKHFPHLG